MAALSKPGVGTYTAVAEKVLRDAGGPLSVKEIVERATRDYSFRPKTKTPKASMWSRIHEEMVRAGGQSMFLKVGRSMFDLRQSPPGEISEDNKGRDKRTEGSPQSPSRHKRSWAGEDADSVYTKDPLFVGAAGEHRVESELLFRGYDASMTRVDKGIDVVARKHGHVFEIQVKTISRHKTGSYVVPINEKSFNRTKSQGMYYVFVLRDKGNITDFVILPFAQVGRLVEEGRITKNKAGYQAIFKVDKNNITVGKESVSFYRNNWNLGQLG